MSLESLLVDTLNNYFPVRYLSAERKKALDDNIKVKLVDQVKKLIKKSNCNIEGHTGAGNKADVPWIGINSNLVNSRPQSGVYVAILFNVDGSGFSISIQHGTDKSNMKEVKQKVAELKKEFILQDDSFNGKIKLVPDDFTEIKFDNSKRPIKYSYSNILGKEYKIADNKINPRSFEEDLKYLCKVYDDWCRYDCCRRVQAYDSEVEYQSPAEDKSVFPDPSNGESPLFETTNPGPRQEKKFCKPGHLSPPRDPKEGLNALKKSRYTCEFDCMHETFLTQAGTKYMEKHHLIPMKFYYDFETNIDHSLNIFTLCPTCHRKIHLGRKEEISEMVTKLYKSREASYEYFYGITLEKLLKMYDENTD